jgi:hypothetical protein
VFVFGEYDDLVICIARFSIAELRYLLFPNLYRLRVLCQAPVAVGENGTCYMEMSPVCPSLTNTSGRPFLPVNIQTHQKMSR